MFGNRTRTLQSFPVANASLHKHRSAMGAGKEPAMLAAHSSLATHSHVCTNELARRTCDVSCSVRSPELAHTRLARPCAGVAALSLATTPDMHPHAARRPWPRGALHT